jgi:hypothetical protein
MSNIRKAGALLFLFLEIIFFILLCTCPLFVCPLFSALPILISLLLLAYLIYPSKPKKVPKVIPVFVLVLTLFLLAITPMTIILPHFWIMMILAILSFKKDRIEEMRRGNRLAIFTIAILMTIPVTFGVLFWSIIHTEPWERLDFQILEAKLIETTNKKILQIKIWNTGGVDITRLEVKYDTKTIPLLPRKEGEVLKAGDQRTFVVSENLDFSAPNTYTLIVTAEGNAPFGGSRKSEQSIIVTAVKA